MTRKSIAQRSVSKKVTSRSRLARQRRRASACCEPLEERRLLTNTIYYFDTTKTISSNNGRSPGAAFSSLSAIGSKFSPGNGDTLKFHAGQTFTGSLDLHSFGGSAGLTTFTIDTYGATTSNKQVTINSGDKIGLWLINPHSVSINHLTLNGTSRASAVANAISNPTKSATLRNTNGIELDMNNGTGASNKIISCTVSGYGRAGIFGRRNLNTRFSSLSITSCTITNCGEYGIQLATYNPNHAAHGSYPNSDAVNLTSCNVSNITGYTKAQGAKPESTWGSGIFLADVSGSTIAHCNSHDNAINNDTTGGGPVGIWAAGADHVTIQFCKSFKNHRMTDNGTDCGGFDFDNETTNSVMQYNFSHDNDGAGFLVFAAAGTKNDNNIIRYNISSNDGRDQQGGIRVSGQVTHAQILHNTVYCNLSKKGDAYEGGLSVVANGSAKPQTITFRNNIVVTGGAIPASYIAPGAGVTQTKNDFYTVGTTSSGSSINPHFAGAPARDGYKSSSDNATGFKFVINSTTRTDVLKLIDQSTPLSSDNGRDYFGTALDTHPDIGAYEVPASLKPTA